MRLTLLRPPLLGQVRLLHNRTVQILKKEDDLSPNFTLDLAGVRQVFENPRVAELPACVITVAGAMRTGKSFLLDQMLRHLVAATGSSELVGTSGAGFPWKGGMARFTSGAHLWMDPFIVTRDGEEMAVFLMDTQGTFDHKTTVKENMTVFALSTMTSSMLMYNLMHVIREDHLQHLQLFTEYGRMVALLQTGAPPFQNLQFLVRDWHYPHDAPFGREGGQVVLDRLLAVNEDQPLEIQRLREHILSSFTSIGCYLFPYPGPRVAEDPMFQGSQADMDPRFAKYLTEFVTTSLDPNNLEPKRIAGKVVKSREMVDYFHKYLDIFNGDEIPEPKSIFNTTAEVTNLHALNDARDAYIKKMEVLKQTETSDALVDVVLDKQHKESMEESIKLFSDQSKFGGRAFAEHYHYALVKEIQEKFDNYKRLNNSKIQNQYYKAKDYYITKMETHCGKKPIHQQEFVDVHIKFASETTKMFQVSSNGSYKPLSETLLTQLVSEVESRYVYYQGLNESNIRMAVYQAADSAMEQYSGAVETAMEGPLSIHAVKLEVEHREAKKAALAAFEAASNYGVTFVSANPKSLAREVEEKFAYYRELNASKKLGKRVLATVEQLSDNQTYRGFWRSPQQQRIVGGGLLGLLVLRVMLGS